MTREGSTRVWSTAGPSGEYPERAHPLVDPPALTGVCFSGGSTRAYAATVGFLRGLTATGLIQRVGYVSAVSGGAWAAVPYTFYAAGATDDPELLGPHEEPEDVSWESLDRVEPGLLGHAATLDFGAALAAAREAGTAAGRLWVQAVGRVFLAPFGLEDAEGPSSFTLDARTEADIRSRHPGAADITFRRVWAHTYRPYLVIHSTLNWPPGASDVWRARRVGFEYAPLGVGLRPLLTLEAPPRPHTVGGGFVEPLAFGGAPPSQAIRGRATVTTGVPEIPFTLADAVGASSAFSPPDRDPRLYPHVPYWSVGRAQTGRASTEAELFSDGGDVENYGLIALLGRGVRRIIVVINSLWPLSLDYDPATWPDDLDDPSATRRPLDPFLPPLFGAPTRRFPNNQVFEGGDYAAVVSALQAAKRAGRTVMAVTTHAVRPNPWWGVTGGRAVHICWVYNDWVERWVTRLREPLQGLVREGRGSAAEGPFRHFPHYRTRGQNPGALIRLTPAQVNLLAHLSSWSVVANGETLDDFLDLDEAR